MSKARSLQIKKGLKDIFVDCKLFCKIFIFSVICVFTGALQEPVKDIFVDCQLFCKILIIFFVICVFPGDITVNCRDHPDIITATTERVYSRTAQTGPTDPTHTGRVCNKTGPREPTGQTHTALNWRNRMELTARLIKKAKKGGIIIWTWLVLTVHWLRGLRMER